MRIVSDKNVDMDPPLDALRSFLGRQGRRPLREDRGESAARQSGGLDRDVGEVGLDLVDLAFDAIEFGI